VVASADEQGAAVVENRIREQLENSEALKTGCVFKVSSMGVKLPAANRYDPLTQLVQEVADSITEMTIHKLQLSKGASA
jgi:hypothetical protein